MHSEMKIALCTMAKNEEDYLPEWIDYHRRLGFCDIHIYESGGWRCHRNDVECHPVSADTRQETAFNVFIQKYRGSYDWVLFSDIDEYVVLSNGDNDIRTFLDKYGQTKYLFINWRIFGNNHQIFKGDFSLVDRFTKCRNELDVLGKTFYNLKIGTGRMSSAHTVEDYFSEENLCGTSLREEMRCSEDLDSCLDIGYLAHFRSKTYLEWCRKMDTNCGLYFPFSQLSYKKTNM